MRLILIDAEKLKKSLPKYADYYEALAWIDEAEEVEAIPIEWIKKWAKFVGTVRAIDVLLEDWEKEKALDKQIEQWEIDDDVDWEMMQREQENDE